MQSVQIITGREDSPSGKGRCRHRRQRGTASVRGPVPYGCRFYIRAEGTHFPRPLALSPIYVILRSGSDEESLGVMCLYGCFNQICDIARRAEVIPLIGEMSAKQTKGSGRQPYRTRRATLAVWFSLKLQYLTAAPRHRPTAAIKIYSVL